MRLPRVVAAVGALVIVSSMFAAAGSASAVSHVYPNSDQPQLATDLAVSAVEIDYTAETFTFSAALSNFSAPDGYFFNLYLTPSQRSISTDPNYVNVTANVNKGASVITAAVTSNGNTGGANGYPGATIAVTNGNLLTLALPLQGVGLSSTLFAWASLSVNGGKSAVADIPSASGSLGFGPLNPDVAETTTTATITSPTQVHNSTPSTVLVSVSPSHGNGAIDILDGTKVVATESYNGSDVAINLPKTLAFGKHTLVASYRPAQPQYYGPSSSSPLALNVLSGGKKTSTVLAVGAKGKVATLTVHVSHKPSGKVVIYDGKKKLKTLTLKKGKASYSKKLSKGTHKLHAEFTPKHIDSYAPSASHAKTLKIK